MSARAESDALPCRWCPPGCKSCEPDDCECYTHQDEPDAYACARCEGSGLTWHAHPDVPGFDAVAECADCGGRGIAIPPGQAGSK